ncbi:hypothetical protein CDL12_12288 [Handroanthus impetiginosus]|uniref:Uncharacterized protein n=1 Tax=Handroanthus impetiginosus TaxID=429701 RepID=A0A2G9HC08_9LAMI|nr:hypothetical protein CDL12_12288 [Handroanthus impetiginosus]
MAASSPAKSNNGATDSATATPLNSSASKSLRGLNKPKCIKCGNVARSRCPYQSCKNCCAKAQNPCHIHVLKGNSSFPDKPPLSGSPLFDQQSPEVSHSGNSHRLRQLSNNFAQFSNLQPSFRSRKPLTKKDAQVINEWRFLKLKEFRDGKIKAESEAFDRYMQNVGLLEEVFLINSAPDDQIQDEPSSDGENAEKMVHGLKLKLRSNPVRTDNLRKRIQYIVDQGLRKLGKVDLVDGTADLSDTEEPSRTAKKIKSSQGERAIALSDLSDKLNKARNEEDLKACWEMASQIFGWNAKTSQTDPGECLVPTEKEPNSVSSCFLPPKWVSPVTIDQEAVCRIDAQFSSLEDIEDL